ncbi:MAG: hypothetical protein NTW29_07115 [Bacteroidetes bacterium]|nr:hypothetical protein [Bacteroidota bacterium]
MNMFKNRILPFAAGCIFSVSSLFAQETPSEWSVKTGDFFSNAIFLHQSDAGTLIVSSDGSLIGIDPVKKTKIWELPEIKGIKEDQFQVLAGTQYVMVEYQKSMAIAKNKTVIIIDSHTGAIAYNSKDEEIKVRNTRIMPSLQGILIEGVKDSRYFIGFLDFAKSAVTWTKDFGKVKTGGFGIGALKRAVKSYTESIFKAEPLVDPNGKLLFSNDEILYCVNGITGVTEWEATFKDDVTAFLFSETKQQLFVVYDDKMELIETATGKPLYEKPLKPGGKINDIQALGNANIIMHSDGFNIMEANGKFRWKKDASSGNTSSVWPVNDGFIALEQTEKGGKITKVSNEGKELWDESLGDPIFTVLPISNGVIYITTEKANILSYEKGKDVWKKDIKIKGTPAFGVDAAKKLVYVYSNDALSMFNLNDGTYKELAPELKLKDYDDEKELAVIEPRAAGIFIHTNQNIALVKEDGQIVYNKYFKEAGLSKGARGLLKALGTVTAVAGTTYGVAGLGKPQDWEVKQTGANTYQVDSKQMRAGSAVADGGSAVFQAAQARFFATKSAKNTVYILSKWDAGNGLVISEKDNGNELKRIVLNDKTPQYVVDEADFMLYVIVDGKELRAYDIKK